MKRTKVCAYCGVPVGRMGEREHVVPRCLYPEGEPSNGVQRLTVPACSRCNRSFSDDEAHFRIVLLAAGEHNRAGKQVFYGKALRSFDEVDGPRRIQDLVERLEPVTIEGQDRWMIYTGKDERVQRVLRKIVRGLSHYHNIESGVDESRIWVDVLKYRLTADMESLPLYHRDPTVFQYRYSVEVDGLSSLWFLTFYEHIKFVATVA